MRKNSTPAAGWKLVLTTMYAPLIGVLSTAICMIIFVGLDQNKIWRGEFLFTAEWVLGSVFPALVITATMAAVDAARVFSWERHCLISTRETRCPLLIRYVTLLVASVAIPTLITWVLEARYWPNYASSLVLHSSGLMILGVLTTTAVLLLSIVCGSVFGYIGALITPITVAWIGLSALHRGALVYLGGATGSLLGYQPKASQYVVVGAVTLVVSLVTISILRRSSLGSLLWPTRIILFAIIITLGVSGQSTWIPWKVSNEQLITCLSRRTCVAEQHWRLLDPLDVQMERLAKAAKEVGVNDVIPRTIVESAALGDGTILPSDGTNVTLSESVASYSPVSTDLAWPWGHVSTSSFIGSIIIPSHCPQSKSSQISESYQRHQELARQSLEELVSNDRDTSPEATHRLADAIRTHLPPVLSCDG